MVALLIALALHGSAPPPRPAIYSQRARDTSYAWRMTKKQCIEAEDGRGWICPMPYPAPPPRRRHK